MIATLPMYDWPEVRPATDRLWALIRDALRDAGLAAPDALDRSGAYDAAWLRPDLVLSQTCGLPLRTFLRDRVTLVASPDYGLPGTPPGHYHSVFVVRADHAGDLASVLGGAIAINGPDSQSGWAAPQNEAIRLGRPFTAVLVTGAHRDSARAVARGAAPVAAIDAQSWRLFERHEPQLAAQLRVAGRTTPTPATPYIAAAGTDPEPVARALAAAVAALPSEDRAAIDLRGIARVPLADYLAIPTPALPRQDAVPGRPD